MLNPKALDFQKEQTHYFKNLNLWHVQTSLRMGDATLLSLNPTCCEDAYTC